MLIIPGNAIGPSAVDVKPTAVQIADSVVPLIRFAGPQPNGEAVHFARKRTVDRVRGVGANPWKTPLVRVYDFADLHGTWLLAQFWVAADQDFLRI